MNIKKVVVGFLDENCYIVEKNNECIIIDPGDDPNKIVNNITLKPIAILITHRHFDHIGALEYISNKYNIPTYEYSNLKEGNLRIGKFNIEVIYTPGHTDDSVTYYFKDDEIMFTGDFLFKGSIGRTDLETGNMKKMQKSISKIKKYYDIIKVYPGHNDNTTIGYEKVCNIYFKEEL